ncbi:predicted protein [Histoplasma capsulatum H143]|uniref:Uncharacterized protein n=1 Tax=Ajellomyces capsulatus (strain H143) TaxID=544712 RepID=C6H624_AJECH|nr:predicted protein [Histoplasma capsulatum H143]
MPATLLKIYPTPAGSTDPPEHVTPLNEMIDPTSQATCHRINDQNAQMIIVAFRRANETELATFQRHCHQEAETPLLPGVDLSRRAYRLTCASISKAMHRLANLAIPVVQLRKR